MRGFPESLLCKDLGGGRQKSLSRLLGVLALLSLHSETLFIKCFSFTEMPLCYCQESRNVVFSLMQNRQFPWLRTAAPVGKMSLVDRAGETDARASGAGCRRTEGSPRRGHSQHSAMVSTAWRSIATESRPSTRGGCGSCGSTHGKVAIRFVLRVVSREARGPRAFGTSSPAHQRHTGPLRQPSGRIGNSRRQVGRANHSMENEGFTSLFPRTRRRTMQGYLQRGRFGLHARRCVGGRAFPRAAGGVAPAPSGRYGTPCGVRAAETTP